MKKVQIKTLYSILVLVIVLLSLSSCSFLINNSTNKEQSEVQNSVNFYVESQGKWQLIGAVKTDGNEIIQFPTAPQMYGKVFCGWFLDVEFLQEVNERFLEEKPVVGEIKLYGKYIAKEEVKNPIITFDTRGGSPIEPKEVEYRSTLPDVTTSWEGATFDGWYLDEMLTQKLDVTYHKFTTDTTLYAKWLIDGDDITWELNGGTSSVYLQEKYSKAFKIELPETGKILKKGYEFVNWYTDALFENVYSGDSSSYSGPITLYAKWNIVNYTITYSVNLEDFDFDESANPSTFNFEDEIIFTNPVSKSAEYVFGGWYLDAEYTNKFNLEDLPDYNVTLYAKKIVNFASYDSSEVANLGNIFYDKNTDKSLAITLDVDKEVISSSLDTSNYVAYNDTEDSKIIFQKSYLKTISVGERQRVTFRVRSKATSQIETVTYYLIPLTDTPTKFTSIVNYEKSTDSNLTISSVETISSSTTYCVMIDEKIVEYSISSNAVEIPSKYIQSLEVGKHNYEIFTSSGMSSGIINVTCVSPMAPYNVKIDIDNSYPDLFVTWDCDFAVDEYIVIISGVEYSSNIYSTKFNGKSFNAIDILTTKDQVVKVRAIIDSLSYDSEEVIMPISLTTGYDDYLNLETGFTFYGKQNNYYITSYDEYYDFVFYSMMYYSKIVEDGNKETINVTNRGACDHTALNVCFDPNIINDPKIQKIFKDNRNDILTSDFTYLTTLQNMSTSERVASNSDFILLVYKYLMYTSLEATSYSLVVNSTSTIGFTYSNDTTYKINLCVFGAKTPDETDEEPIRRQDEVSDGIFTYSQVKYQNTHYGSGLPADYVFPIETKNNGNATVNSSIELYLALEHQYNPVIASSNTALATLYGKIKAALRGILDENMNEYEIAIAVYEYLELNVMYDHGVVSKSPTDAYYYSYTSYYMEGVFNYGTAVCNGISAAFSSMLNMMGIEAHKISGNVDDSGHAWVEYRIGDMWYLADPTWASQAVRLSSTSTHKIETINYSFLFMPYKTSVDRDKRNISNMTGHKEAYAGDEIIEVYSMLKFTYNTKEFDHYIDNLIEGNAIIDYTIAQFGSKLTSGEYASIQIKVSDSVSISSFTAKRLGYTIQQATLNDTPNVYLIFISKS